MSTADQGKRVLSRDQSTPSQLARRLISSRRSEQSGGDTPARVAAASCDHLYRELSRWVGPDGCHALFTRALSEARAENSALDKIQLRARSDPYVDGVAETIVAHGDPATAEGLESMLVRLVELLGRLIGDDMAMVLLERSLAAAGSPHPTFDARQEEA